MINHISQDFDRIRDSSKESIDLGGALWSKIEKNTDKIAIQLFTVPRARE